MAQTDYLKLNLTLASIYRAVNKEVLDNNKVLDSSEATAVEMVLIKLDFLPVSSLGSRSRPLYESERSYKEDFAPLRAEVDYSIQATHSTPALTRHSTNRRHDSFTSPKKTKVSSHLSESHRSSRTSPYGSNEESWHLSFLPQLLIWHIIYQGQKRERERE
ncbi:uncharacterized protein [Amphiura filiformis]|uniref:uncharacterized protein n=1 Tax=Amphiura filiformis TaxID=82378 RepID=UPI003B2196A3